MVIASLESDSASERTSPTIDYLKSQGIHWGFTSYGHDRDDDTILVPNDDAPAVVRCCELYAQGSLPYLKVARELNAESNRWRDKHGQPAPFTAAHTTTPVRCPSVVVPGISSPDPPSGPGSEPQSRLTEPSVRSTQPDDALIAEHSTATRPICTNGAGAAREAEGRFVDHK